MRRFAQDCDPKTYLCTSRNALKKAKLSEGRLRSNGEAARKGPRSKDAQIAHIKRRVPLGEKTPHVDKAGMQARRKGKHKEHSTAVAQAT